ncbi:hypothetical protein NB566_24015 [Vibrio parahaemolyticus]|nr:hypothetical protein [Vibrio sp. 1249-1]MCR9821690.1 hypothetical protein [Vibrio parahaemolyticus]MDW2456334.1 hypothetical protein [Vibrio sp. 1249-1]
MSYATHFTFRPIQKGLTMSEYLDQVELLSSEISALATAERKTYINYSLQRILNYKDIFIHKEALSSDVLCKAFKSLSTVEQAICKHGLDAMNFTIHYLDELSKNKRFKLEPRAFTVDSQIKFLSHSYQA